MHQQFFFYLLFSRVFSNCSACFLYQSSSSFLAFSRHSSFVSSSASSAKKKTKKKKEMSAVKLLTKWQCSKSNERYHPKNTLLLRHQMMFTPFKSRTAHTFTLKSSLLFFTPDADFFGLCAEWILLGNRCINVWWSIYLQK